MTTHTTRQLKLLMAAVMTMAAAISTHAQTTYKLTKATNLSNGRCYVLEQLGREMTGTISSNTLATTDQYATSGLTGQESYVWQMEGSDENQTFKMKNVGRASKEYLTLTQKNSTQLEWNSASKATSWTFDFQPDSETFIVKYVMNEANDEWRFLGLDSEQHRVYKAYKHDAAYDYTTPYSITVYELTDESTGITSINQSEEDAPAAYFNMNGQRIAHPAKGIYVVNHHKVLVK